MNDDHPATKWRQSATHPALPTLARLRLATIAGQITQDRLVARRAALIDLLAEGKPITRTLIWQHITKILDLNCWGKHPQETLLRDIAVLRRGGIRISYSRQKGLEGYYLQYPMLEKPAPPVKEEPMPPLLLEAIRQKPIAQKLASSFALAEFALQQKLLLLTQRYPAMDSVAVNKLARSQVFGSHEQVL